MHARMVGLVSAMGLLCSMGGAQEVKYEHLLRPKNAVYFRVPIGLCEDYPEETTTIEIIRKDMELLKRCGVRLLRISFGWDAIEAEKDRYDWLFWDDFVRIAVEEHGITLIPYICYTPKWNAPRNDTLNFWKKPPLDYDEFGEFVSTLVGRYKGWIRSWELWNEPDIHAYWDGTVKEYAELVKVGSTAVRTADPSALVVLGGIAGNTDFLLSLFRDFGVSPYVDVVNIHNYFETWNSSPLEAITDYVATVSDIISVYGANQSIWVAEVGYSTYRQDGYVSYHYSTHFDYEHTPPYQAVHLFRTLTLLLASQKVAAVAWYEIKDLPTEEAVIGDVNNRHLGVAYVDHEPKPAEAALSFFVKLFAEPHRCIDREVTITRPLASDSEVHAFLMESGRVVIVAWLKTHVLGRRIRESSGDAKDTRRESISLEIPYQLRGQAIRYDELGRAGQLRGLKQRGRHTVLQGVELRGWEIFIAELRK